MSLRQAGRAQPLSALLPERTATLRENCAAGLLTRRQPRLERVRMLLDTADELTRRLHLDGTIATTRQQLFYQEARRASLAAMAPDLSFSLARAALQVFPACRSWCRSRCGGCPSNDAEAVTYGYAAGALLTITLSLATIHYLLDRAHYQCIFNDNPGSAPCRTSTR
jgi:hypothetical protein